MEEGRKLVADGWMQTSRKFRMIARVPEGMTALEALKIACPDEAKRLLDRLNRQAADSFRRLSNTSKFPECYRELDIETFAAFRKAGGESSF